MFSPELRITFSQDLVRFVKKETVVELKPLVYLDNNKPPRIVSIGDPPFSDSVGLVVHLFDGKDCDADKVLILEAFLRFGFRKVIGSRFSFAPKVYFDISQEIIAILGGFHRAIFHYCAKHAGAVSTSFDKDYGRFN